MSIRLPKQSQNPLLVPVFSQFLSGEFGENVESRAKQYDDSREQGWQCGKSTRLPPMWPGFYSRTRRHMWVEFVVGSRPCSERFFSRYSGFSLSSKTNISKFQFHLDHHEPLAWEIAQALPVLLTLNNSDWLALCACTCNFSDKSHLCKDLTTGTRFIDSKSCSF